MKTATTDRTKKPATEAPKSAQDRWLDSLCKMAELRYKHPATEAR